MTHIEIFRTIAGSHLYGVATANSDHDYKAVHLPTSREVLLGTGKDVLSHSTGDQISRNSTDDVDVESFRLAKFLSLASKMNVVAVEMLFTDIKKTEFTNIWTIIVENRHKLLSSNMMPFIGYCKGQAMRYSVRGKRLLALQEVLHILREVPAPNHPLVVYNDDIHVKLAAIEGVEFVEKPQPGGHTDIVLNVYGMMAPVHRSVKDIIAMYEKPVNEAGQRTQNAAENGGADLKGLYHAIRIADEGIELFQTGRFRFPCRNQAYLQGIRSGEVKVDQILDVFDAKMGVLEQIEAEGTIFPEKPDQAWIDDFVEEIHSDIVHGRL